MNGIGEVHYDFAHTIIKCHLDILESKKIKLDTSFINAIVEFFCYVGNEDLIEEEILSLFEENNAPMYKYTYSYLIEMYSRENKHSEVIDFFVKAYKANIKLLKETLDIVLKTSMIIKRVDIIPNCLKILKES